MKCSKCNKELDKKVGELTIEGVGTTITLEMGGRMGVKGAVLAYNNLRCVGDVAICYECFTEGQVG